MSDLLNAVKAAMLPACPECSRGESLVIPMACQGASLHPKMEAKWGLRQGCKHANPEGLRMFRFHDKEEAEQWWRDEAAGLLAEQRRNRAALEESFRRINEASQKKNDVPENNITPAAALGLAGDGRGELRDDPQQLHQFPASDGQTKQGRATDSDAGAKNSGPRRVEVQLPERAVDHSLCEVGNQIWQQHDMDIRGNCKRCGVKIL